MDLDELTDDELLSIVESSPCAGRVAALVADAIARRADHHLRDEADGVLWRRRIAKRQFLSDDEFEHLLQKPSGSTPYKLLGEAAMNAQLTCEQRSRLDAQGEQNRFVWKQLQARRLLVELRSRLKTEGDSPSSADLLHVLCQNGVAWAVVDAVNELRKPLLDEVLSMLEPSGLSRGHRHTIRQAIFQRQRQLLQ